MTHSDDLQRTRTSSGVKIDKRVPSYPDVVEGTQKPDTNVLSVSGSTPSNEIKPKPILSFTSKLNNSTIEVKSIQFSDYSVPPRPSPPSAPSGRESDEFRHLLSSDVGRVLGACLAAVVEHRPLDPIDFMARWLYSYADSRIYMEEKAAFMKRAAAMVEQIKRERRQRLQRMKQLHSQKKELKLDYAVCGDGYTEEDARAMNLLTEMEERGSLIGSMDHLLRGSSVPPEVSNIKGKMSRMRSAIMSSTTMHSTSSKTSNRRWSEVYSNVYGKTDGSRFGSSTLDETITEGSRRRSGKSRRSDGEESWSSGEGSDEEEEEVEEEIEVCEEGEDGGEPVCHTVMRKTIRTVHRTESQRRRHNKTKFATWVYEVNSRRMVCVHPLLGRMGRPLPEITKEEIMEESWTDAEELPCPSLYQHEIYACLPECLLYTTPEMDAKKAEEEARKWREAEEERLRAEAEAAREKARRKAEVKRLREEEKKKQKKAAPPPKVEEPEDDDVRWQACPDHDGEEGVCESWRVCEGFDPVSTRTPSPRSCPYSKPPSPRSNAASRPPSPR